MKRQIKKIAATVLVLSGFALSAGCGMLEPEELPAVEQAVVVSCTDILAQGVDHFSEKDVVTVLAGQAENGDQACWLSVMQSALEQGVRLPQSELKRAIKQLNAVQYNEAFHLAVYRYLASIARGQGEYRPEDRALLRAYCSYLINHAENGHDDRLSEVQLLTKRLDPDMYERFFE